MSRLADPEIFLEEARQLRISKCPGLGDSKDERREQAIKLYIKAGNLFMATYRFEEAAQVFLEGSELHEMLKDRFQQADSLRKAADNFVKAQELEKAKRAYLEAAQIWIEDYGNFQKAGQIHEILGHLAKEEGEKEKALKMYKDALRFYQVEGGYKADNCKLKIAELQVEEKQYVEAGTFYEILGKESLDSPLRRFSARKYFLQAGLCFFLADPSSLTGIVDTYKALDHSLASSAEAALLNACVQSWEESWEESSLEIFQTAIEEHSQVHTLDNFQVALLLSVKLMLEAREEEPIDLR